MNFGSLFSGIGGIDLGLERAGMTCKWMVEIDDFCQKVLDKHWPEVRKYRDVREVHGNMAHTDSERTFSELRETLPRRKGAKESYSEFSGGSGRGKTLQSTGEGTRCTNCLEPVDLIAGGFPCQPHSVAGKRRGKDDDRNLWPEYLRIIREVKPTWVVGENVPGIITTMLDDVLADLESAGYTTTVFNIPAAAFGANHIRYRIFVVANRNCIRSLEGQNAEQSTSREQPTFIGSTIGHSKNANTGEPRLERTEQPKHYANKVGRGEKGATGSITESFGDGWTNWSVEPNVGRVANGVPNRVDRLKSLGNAVVPQVAEYIGRCIMEAEYDRP